MTTLAQALRRAAEHIDRDLAGMLAPHQATPGEAQLLTALYDEGAVPPSMLAARLGVTRGAVTRMVDRLRAKGLVVRASGRGDARYRTIALTGAGARLAPELAHITAAHDAATLGRLSAGDRRHLEATLAILAGGATPRT